MQGLLLFVQQSKPMCDSVASCGSFRKVGPCQPSSSKLFSACTTSKTATLRKLARSSINVLFVCVAGRQTGCAVNKCLSTSQSCAKPSTSQSCAKPKLIIPVIRYCWRWLLCKFAHVIYVWPLPQPMVCRPPEVGQNAWSVWGIVIADVAVGNSVVFWDKVVAGKNHASVLWTQGSTQC
jgi:hypothetical protein